MTEGSGSKARHIKLRPVSLLESPNVLSLIDAALDQAAVSLPESGTGPLLISQSPNSSVRDNKASPLAKHPLWVETGRYANVAFGGTLTIASSDNSRHFPP